MTAETTKKKENVEEREWGKQRMKKTLALPHLEGTAKYTEEGRADEKGITYCHQI